MNGEVEDGCSGDISLKYNFAYRSLPDTLYQKYIFKENTYFIIVSALGHVHWLYIDNKIVYTSCLKLHIVGPIHL